MPAWKATERLYLNKEKTAVVRETELVSGSLLCGVGAMVPEAVCRQWGIGPYATDAYPIPTMPVQPPEEPRPSFPTDLPGDGPENAPQSESQVTGVDMVDQPSDPPRRRR